MTHPIKGELISQGENVDMQEKQPKRITEKVEYLENGGLSLTNMYIFCNRQKLSKYVLLVLLFLLRIQQSLVNSVQFSCQNTKLLTSPEN